MVIGMTRSSSIRSLVAGMIGLALATVLRIPGASSEVVQFRNVDGGRDYYGQFPNPLPSDPGYFPDWRLVSSRRFSSRHQSRQRHNFNLYVVLTTTAICRLFREAACAPFSSNRIGGKPDCHRESRCRRLGAVRRNRHAAGSRPGLRDDIRHRCGAPERRALALQQLWQGRHVLADGREAARFVNEFQHVVSNDIYWFTDPLKDSMVVHG